MIQSGGWQKNNFYFQEFYCLFFIFYFLHFLFFLNFDNHVVNVIEN